jgi:hypothetical protein
MRDLLTRRFESVMPVIASIMSYCRCSHSTHSLSFSKILRLTARMGNPDTALRAGSLRFWRTPSASYELITFHRSCLTPARFKILSAFENVGASGDGSKWPPIPVDRRRKSERQSRYAITLKHLAGEMCLKPQTPSASICLSAVSGLCTVDPMAAIWATPSFVRVGCGSQSAWIACLQR